MGEPTSRAGSRLLIRPPAGARTPAKAATTARASTGQKGEQADSGQGEQDGRQENKGASAKPRKVSGKRDSTHPNPPHPNSPHSATLRDPIPNFPPPPSLPSSGQVQSSILETRASLVLTSRTAGDQASAATRPCRAHTVGTERVKLMPPAASTHSQDPLGSSVIAAAPHAAVMEAPPQDG